MNSTPVSPIPCSQKPASIRRNSKISWAMMLFAAALLQSGGACALAGSPAQFQGYTKYLRYRVDYKVNPDGTHVETHEWALKVLGKQGIEMANRASVSYSEQLENAEILAAYTLKSGSRRIDAPASNFQDESNKGKGNASPMFSDIHTKTVAFPDVAVGDTVVFSYRITQHEATFPGNFSLLESFSKFEVYDDAQVTLSAPASLEMHIYQRGVEGGVIASSDGRRHWRWTYRDEQVAAPETGSVSPLDYGPLVVASTFKDYGALAAAYSARAKPKAAVTEPIRSLADKLTGDAHTPRDQAKAIYDWVAANVEYANNRVGVGSVVPHAADVVLANRMGDCKDHTTLLEALLAAKGITGVPTLINAEGAYSIPPVASPDVFDHVITYLPSLNLYVDPTTRFTAFGSLPFDDADKPVVQTQNFVEIEHTPAIDYRNNSVQATTVLNIHPDGSADGKTGIEARGQWAAGLRAEMAYVQPNMEDLMVRRLLEHNGYSGNGSLALGDPMRLSDGYRYDAKYKVSDMLNLPGPGGMYIRSPLSSAGSMGSFLEGINDAPRTVNFECEGATFKEDYTINLPADIKVFAIPRDVSLKSKTFTYTAIYRRAGNTITVARELEDRTPGNSCTPADAAAQKAFAVNVKRDVRAQVIYESKDGD